MDGIIRYTAEDAFNGGVPEGNWVRATDFDERQFQSKQREVVLQDRLSVAEQRNDDLTELLNKALMAIKRTLQAGRDRIVDMGGDCDGVEYMMNSDLTVQEIRTALKSAAEACEFPQSCTTRCDCDIPDFSPGNGNKARRRAEALRAGTFSDANEPPCTACFARGCNGECMENL